MPNALAHRREQDALEGERRAEIRSDVENAEACLWLAAKGVRDLTNKMRFEDLYACFLDTLRDNLSGEALEAMKDE